MLQDEESAVTNFKSALFIVLEAITHTTEHLFYDKLYAS